MFRLMLLRFKLPEDQFWREVVEAAVLLPAVFAALLMIRWILTP